MKTEEEKDIDLYPTKRIYIVLDENGQIAESLEQTIYLAKDWKYYLKQSRNRKAILTKMTPEEEKFISKWQAERGYEIIMGIADSLESFISSVPEISSKRYVASERLRLASI